MAKLKGKAAVVTKASKGIGAANAKALAFWSACWMIGLAVPSPCGGR
jgi:NAD(P)-dependent dehydrogenase (short-subunit alcohol dehydrogenase family)